MRNSIMRSSRISISRPLRPATCKSRAKSMSRTSWATTKTFLVIRSYANKQNMDSSAGQASPGTGPNVGNPISSSAESNNVNQSRATDAKTGSTDNASLATPVSNPSGSATQGRGEDSSMQEAFKQDPNAPAEEKRKNVEKMGQKPLDPADK
jgi:cytoskeletal protein RodZ